MSLFRIFQDMALTPGASLLLDLQASHYLLNVLRVKPHDEFYIFNGRGGEYLACFVEAQKKRALCLVKEFIAIERESSLKIHLAQGISRGDRMDYALQKSVELGVHEITPILTERCAVKLKPEQAIQKQCHWKKILESAAEQCERNQIPVLHPVISLSTWLASSTATTSLVLSPTASLQLRHLPTPDLSSIRLVIGPESGLSSQEVDLCQAQGFTAISLGPRVLRTETATAATLAALQALFGDG